MDYTHLTAYSEQTVELFDEDNIIESPTNHAAVYSEPVSEDKPSSAIDPYASQQIYDAYAAQIDSGEKVYETDKDNATLSLSEIKASLETTYASADPYFEAQNCGEDGERKDDEDSSDSEEELEKGTSKTTEPTSFAVKDWNEEFQQLLQAEDEYDKFVNLGKLAQEFGTGVISA